jgi:hypothetical protein
MLDRFKFWLLDAVNTIDAGKASNLGLRSDRFRQDCSISRSTRTPPQPESERTENEEEANFCGYRRPDQRIGEFDLTFSPPTACDIKFLSVIIYYE